MLEGWSTDSCKHFFGQMITSDARALQNMLKMQIFDLPRSTFAISGGGGRGVGGGGGVLPEKLGGVVRHASWNPYPISDQNLRSSLAYFRPDQKFDTLFQIWSLNQYPISDLPYNQFPRSDPGRPMFKAMLIRFD